jgi:hypothetical protein
MGALKGQPEIFTLPHPATALALGRFDGGAMNDLAVATGNQIVVSQRRRKGLRSGPLSASPIGTGGSGRGSAWSDRGCEGSEGAQVGTTFARVGARTN